MKKKMISLEEQKQIELQILDTYAEYCEKKHLRYYITGGTLLGAVRHKGFIPWDDDIDVSMPREFYQELIHNFNTERNDFYRLIWYGNTNGYHLPFAKIVDTRTVIKEKASMFSNIVEYGIYIDIFPLDICPSSMFCTKLIWKYGNFLSQIIFCKILKNKEGQKWYSKIFFCILKPISCCFTIDELMKAKDRIAMINNKIKNPDKYADLVLMTYGFGEVHDIKWYGEGVKLTFSGKKYNAPENYDKVLNRLYGDYMTLPPLEKRVLAHTTEAYWKVNSK